MSSNTSKVARRIGPGQHPGLPRPLLLLQLLLVALHLAHELPVPVPLPVPARRGGLPDRPSALVHVGQAGARPPGDPRHLLPELPRWVPW